MASKTAEKEFHRWTTFEKNTLLCLIIRNIHITGIVLAPEEDTTVSLSTTEKRRFGAKKHHVSGEGLAVSQRQAHMDVATLLNDVCNSGDYSKDIDHKEVSAMIELLLEQNKAAVAFIDRNNKGRLTRTMKKVWNRGINFDGSKKEWKNGRQEQEKIRDLDRRLGMDRATDADIWGGTNTAEEIMAGNSIGPGGDLWGGTTSGADGPVETGAVGQNSTTQVNDIWGSMGPSTALLEAASAWGAEGTVTNTATAAADNPWGSAPQPILPIEQDSSWSGGDAAQVDNMASNDPWGSVLQPMSTNGQDSFWPGQDVAQADKEASLRDTTVAKAKPIINYARDTFMTGVEPTQMCGSQKVKGKMNAYEDSSCIHQPRQNLPENDPWGSTALMMPTTLSNHVWGGATRDGAVETNDPWSTAKTEQHFPAATKENYPTTTNDPWAMASNMAPQSHSDKGLSNKSKQFNFNEALKEVGNTRNTESEHHSSTQMLLSASAVQTTGPKAASNDDPWATINFLASAEPGDSFWGSADQEPAPDSAMQDFNWGAAEGDGIYLPRVGQENATLGLEKDSLAGINPERAAMLATACENQQSGQDDIMGGTDADEEMGQQYVPSAKAKGGNSEEMPFNRLERR